MGNGGGTVDKSGQRPKATPTPGTKPATPSVEAHVKNITAFVSSIKELLQRKYPGYDIGVQSIFGPDQQLIVEAIIFQTKDGKIPEKEEFERAVISCGSKYKGKATTSSITENFKSFADRPTFITCSMATSYRVENEDIEDQVTTALEAKKADRTISNIEMPKFSATTYDIPKEYKVDIKGPIKPPDQSKM